MTETKRTDAGRSDPLLEVGDAEDQMQTGSKNVRGRARGVSKAVPHLAVYVGRHRVGSVVIRDDATFEARNARRKLIGKFETRKQALAAIDECTEVRDG